MSDRPFYIILFSIIVVVAVVSGYARSLTNTPSETLNKIECKIDYQDQCWCFVGDSSLAWAPFYVCSEFQLKYEGSSSHSEGDPTKDL